jgi:hypothetical protein
LDAIFFKEIMKRGALDRQIYHDKALKTGKMSFEALNPGFLCA